MKKFTLFLAIFFITSGTHLYSQTMTPAEILQQVNKKVSGINEYQQLLNDPDPARSMAAMEIMMSSGDPVLARLALEYGIYSPNRAVQRAALDAYFGTQPKLNVYFDAGKSNSDWRFRDPITNGGGSILPDGTGYVLTDVGAFDPIQKCYLTVSAESCRVRVTDDAVAIRFWDNWHILNLNDQGELSGAGAFPNIPSVTTVIPVAQ